MLEARELRLGNWLINFLGEYFQANESTIAVAFKSKEFYPPQPIPLSSEILEKSGFLKTNLGEKDCYIIPFTRRLNKDRPPKHEIILVPFGQLNIKEEGRYAFAVKEYDRNIQFGISIVENVHQLQNIYYAITGEEIELLIKK